MATAQRNDGWPESTGNMKSLYARLGGIHKISQFISDAVDMEHKDSMLMANKNIAMACTDVTKPAIKFMLTGYIASKTGGPQKYGGPDIAAISKGFQMTKAEMTRAWTIRMDAMAKAGVPMDAQKELRTWFDAQVMKAKPMMAPTSEPFMNKDSLYARLGGVVPIALVVDEFINGLATDPVIGSNPHTVKALTSGRVSGAGLKYLVTEQLGEAAGGPWKYSGRTMASSHKGLMIAENEWAAAAKILKGVLDKYSVPAREQGEIFAVISSTKGDIVGK